METGTQSISSLTSCITLSGAEGLPQRTGALPLKRSTSSPELAIHNVVTIFLSLWGSRESLALGSTSLPSLEENTSPTKKYLLPSWSQLNTHRATQLLLRRKSNSHSCGPRLGDQKKSLLLIPHWSSQNWHRCAGQPRDGNPSPLNQGRRFWSRNCNSANKTWGKVTVLTLNHSDTLKKKRRNAVGKNGLALLLLPQSSATWLQVMGRCYCRQCHERNKHPLSKHSCMFAVFLLPCSFQGYNSVGLSLKAKKPEALLIQWNARSVHTGTFSVVPSAYRASYATSTSPSSRCAAISTHTLSCTANIYFVILGIIFWLLPTGFKTSPSCRALIIFQALCITQGEHQRCQVWGISTWIRINAPSPSWSSLMWMTAVILPDIGWKNRHTCC